MADGRIVAVDTVRGFAVCGIFAMNVVAMLLPSYAYIDPGYYGGATGANLAVWYAAYMLFDGKMRALFTMLFGASMLIVTDRAEDRVPGPARTHYARVAWLLAFGMLHGWLFFFGDILVEYALVGAIIFVARRWPPRALGFAAALLIGWDFATMMIQWHDMTLLRDIAARPHAPADAVRAWTAVRDMVTPSREAIAAELRGYRGGFLDAFAARRPMILLFQTVFLPMWLPGTIGIALLGMALHRLGFWTGGWSAAAYRRVAAAGGVALLLYPPLAAAVVRSDWAPATTPLTDALSLLLRLPLALGYAAVLILAVGAGRTPRLVARLAAAGRMAFSNYLGTTLIVTTLSYGYGFGLYGRLERWQLYLLVPIVWLLILGWSGPWLARFRYGPFEWAWRSLARRRPQPMRNKAIASP